MGPCKEACLTGFEFLVKFKDYLTKLKITVLLNEMFVTQRQSF